MFNDLLGLRYRYGASPEDGSGFTDCFQLVCTVRRRLGLSDWAPRFAWVYEQFPEGVTYRQLFRWVLENGDEYFLPKPGNVFLVNEQDAALGVVTPEGLLYISTHRQVVHPRLPVMDFRSFSFD